MRIVFDAFWWAHGPHSLRHALREIIFAWHDRFPDDQLVLVTRTKHDVLGLGDIPEGATVVDSAVWPQGLFATTAVRDAAMDFRADAVITHNFAAKLDHGVSCVYLHDVLFESNPEWFTPIERAYFSFMKRCVGFADIVFTSSRTEAARIESWTKAKNVRAVGLGLSTELIYSDISVAGYHGLVKESYILTVGRFNPRKNLATTIHSALDAGALSVERPLVVVGTERSDASQHDRRIQEATANGLVIFTGIVSDADLKWLYANTSLFVFLSLGEGFGMPPVEAAYFDAPVLTSDLPVFRETLGDGADYVSPTDAAAVTTAIRTLVANPIRRHKAHELAIRHDWIATVAAMRRSILAQARVPA